MTAPAPLIGLTTYGINEGERYHLPRHYVDAVRRAGGVPLLLPPGEPQWRALVRRLDGLILTGGGDIDPDCYGGTRHRTIYNIDAQRDTSELALAEYVLSHPLPTLAICRGMQAVNVAGGGALYAHLPDVFGATVAHRTPPRDPISHEVQMVPQTRLAEILVTPTFVCQSWHHQAVRVMAAAFAPAAYAPDGCVEAMESATLPWVMAVQWHPELTAAADPVQQRLFGWLVEQAAACDR